ncbi:hypothetical protein BRD02_07385 [Halobacteriales archaeon QS_8_69_73]|nr:MAG: hypothetical protein BRD02_07385 [Halobacteriales archaeon QS_8_69_73]
MDERVVDDWNEAVTLARSLDADAEVRLPKAAAPTLPADLDLRRSNFPWSIHKGAVAVYREREPGAHLQIREYPAVWVVTTDSYNPRYRPLGHAAVDVPATRPPPGSRWLPRPSSGASKSASTSCCRRRSRHRRFPRPRCCSRFTAFTARVSEASVASLPVASLLLAGRVAPRSDST